MKPTDGTVQMLPRGRKLPFIDQPRSVKEAIAKINNATEDWAKTTEDFVYRLGGWFTYVKSRTPHGGFEDSIRQTRFNPRTVRRFMVYFGECNAAGRVLPYHPNPHRKSDTVSVLEPPAEEQPKPEKPHHEGGHSVEWNATDCAKMLLSSFAKMTQFRSIEDMQNVLAAFDELATDYINERDKEKRTIRGEE
jgi:hypothetical protein